MARNENAKTRRFALNMLKVSVAISGAALLFACGDDDSSFVASENGGSAAEADIDVATFDYLPNCTDKREGKTAYIKDEKTAYVCTDGDWVADSKGKSSGSEGVGDASSSSVIASSSSEEQTNSSSSDELSSSSLTSCSSKGAKKAWDYLNPSIDYGEITDSRDCQVYKTVKIGGQVWMAENLNYSVNPDEQSWCGGGNVGTEGDCSVYGRLYTWAAAVGKSEDECGYGINCNLLIGDIRGVCPEGWHLPSNVEWNALFMAVGVTRYAGQKLKADSDLWNEGASHDDSFGFAVLPAGFRDSSGHFNGEGFDAYFWSSTEDFVFDDAYYWYFNCSRDYVDNYWYGKYYGFSVRCLQN